jgi:hypothetical protein
VAGLPAEPVAGSAQTLPRVRHGIEFSARDDSNGELRVTGDDDAAVLLWAAWLDEYRDWVVTALTFRYPAVPGARGRQRPWCSNSLARGCPGLRTWGRGWDRGPTGSPDARVRTLGSRRLVACRYRKF